jgi:hypothetical protein
VRVVLVLLIMQVGFRRLLVLVVSALGASLPARVVVCHGPLTGGPLDGENGPMGFVSVAGALMPVWYLRLAQRILLC